MPTRDLDERSRRLTARVDALGRALRDAGVDEATASRLLETAATAALHTLTLDLLVAPATVPTQVVVTAPERPPAAEAPAPVVAAA